LSGGAGNDTLVGGTGNNILDGGAGTDTASYATGAGHVTADLTTGLVSNGVNTDTLHFIENFIGSAGDDTLTGDAFVNSLVGGSGNDLLTGGLGHDVMDGGVGNDTFHFNLPDYAAGQSDTIVANVGDHISGIDAAALGLTVNMTIGSEFNSGTNIRFNSGHLQLDLDHNGQFNPTQDFDVGISGVNSVIFDAASDSFTFGTTTPPPTGLKIALTFDDGPWDDTQDIVNLLNSFNVDATFFVIGEQVAGNEALLHSMIVDGHLVENHSWSHPDLTRLGATELQYQLQNTSNAILGATGQMPEYYRPPYGEHNGAVDLMAATYGMQPVIWTVDTEDWADGATATQIANTVLANATDNGVVLMHDGGGDRSATLNALHDIIIGLRLMGYTLTTLDAIPVLPVDWDGNTVHNNHYDLVA